MPFTRLLPSVSQSPRRVSAPPRAPHGRWATCAGRSPGSRLERLRTGLPDDAWGAVSGTRWSKARHLQLRGQPRHWADGSCDPDRPAPRSLFTHNPTGLRRPSHSHQAGHPSESQFRALTGIRDYVGKRLCRHRLYAIVLSSFAAASSGDIPPASTESARASVASSPSRMRLSTNSAAARAIR